MPDILRGGPGRQPAPARHPWPEDCYLQGGRSGVVLASSGSYRTAFVEAFPASPPVFIRGEGETIEQAENAAWERYQQMLTCPAHPAHGPWDRRTYRNGYAFCEQCGTGFGWEITGLDELPADPDQPPSALERALLGDPADVVEEIADTLGVEPSGDLLTDTINVARVMHDDTSAPRPSADDT